jgi:hypothetical protein
MTSYHACEPAPLVCALDALATADRRSHVVVVNYLIFQAA